MPEPQPGAPGAPSFVGALRQLLEDLPGLLSDRLRLLALELRRASGALATMLALYAVAAVAGLTAWSFAWVGIAVGLLHAGLGWFWTVLLVIVLNGVLVLWAVRRAGRLSALLKLPATSRSFTVSRINPLDGPTR